MGPLTYTSDILSWYTNAANQELVAMMDRKAQIIMRKDREEEEFLSYTNTTRQFLIEYHHKDNGRLDRLKFL